MKTFVISLKDSSKRRQLVKKELSKINLDFEFFDAIKLNDNDEILSFYNKQETLDKKGYYLTDGELGCFASHRVIWQKCVEDQEPFLILEDNLKIEEGFKECLDFSLKNINFLGIVKFDNRFKRKYFLIKNIFNKNNLVKYKKPSGGTSGYLINSETAIKYLETSNKFYQAVDDFMENEPLTKKKLFSINKPVISRSNVKSVMNDSRKNKKNINLWIKTRVELYRLIFKIKYGVCNLRFIKEMKKSSQYQS